MINSHYTAIGFTLNDEAKRVWLELGCIERVVVGLQPTKVTRRQRNFISLRRGVLQLTNTFAW
jgi:hypothetical protein